MIRIETAGQNAQIIYFAEQASPAVSVQIQQASRQLKSVLEPYLVDLIPSYSSLLVIYDPWKTDHLKIRKLIREQLTLEQTAEPDKGKLIKLPVYYSQESGIDLAALAQRAKMSINDVIELHSSTEYRVYAIGFAPGFAYLGEVNQLIAAPRLATPRQHVPQGSVAIADQQTAVYPAASPGGWNLIGRCPTPMFNPEASPTMPVQTGDRVKFEAISREQFINLGGVL